MRLEENFEGRTIKIISKIVHNLSMCKRLDGKKVDGNKTGVPEWSKLCLERQIETYIKEPFIETPCDE